MSQQRQIKQRLRKLRKGQTALIHGKYVYRRDGFLIDDGWCQSISEAARYLLDGPAEDWGDGEG